MRSIEEGITAIKDGKTVLGFGFMDQEELGKRLTEEFIKSTENRKRAYEMSVQKTTQQKSSSPVKEKLSNMPLHQHSQRSKTN